MGACNIWLIFCRRSKLFQPPRWPGACTMVLLRAAILVLLVSHGRSTPTQTPTSATHEHVVCGDDAALWNPRIAEGSFGVAGNWIPSGVPDELTAAQIYGTMGSHESSEVSIDDDFTLGRLLIGDQGGLAFHNGGKLSFAATAVELSFCDDTTLADLTASPSAAPTTLSPTFTTLPTNAPTTTAPTASPSAAPTSVPTPATHESVVCGEGASCAARVRRSGTRASRRARSASRATGSRAAPPTNRPRLRSTGRWDRTSPPR